MPCHDEPHIIAFLPRHGSSKDRISGQKIKMFMLFHGCTWEASVWPFLGAWAFKTKRNFQKIKKLKLKVTASFFLFLFFWGGFVSFLFFVLFLLLKMTWSWLVELWLLLLLLGLLNASQRTIIQQRKEPEKKLLWAIEN